MKKTIAQLFAGSALFALASVAQAHQVWFEQAADQSVKFYYGEYADNELEKSPGGLDKFGGLSGEWLKADSAAPLNMTLGKDSYSVAQKPGKNDSLIAADKLYPTFEMKKDGKTSVVQWTPATRWVGDLEARKPMLDLDIVPTGKVDGDKVEFQVSYHKAPLPEAEVTAVAASGWTHTAKADSQGKVSFELPWKGFYVLEAGHTDATPGERTNAKNVKEAFDVQMFGSSLSFSKDTGSAMKAR